MKFFSTLLLMAIMQVEAIAQSPQCNFIQDRDRQAHCRATTGGGIAQCGFIKNSDLQAICRAELGKNKSQCGFIKDRDKQAQCRAII